MNILKEIIVGVVRLFVYILLSFSTGYFAFRFDDFLSSGLMENSSDLLHIFERYKTYARICEEHQKGQFKTLEKIEEYDSYFLGGERVLKKIIIGGNKAIGKYTESSLPFFPKKWMYSISLKEDNLYF